jgi:hypothetical protein
MPRKKSETKPPIPADNSTFDPSAAPGATDALEMEVREPFPRKDEESPISGGPRSLTVKLDENGGILWGKMRAETKERLARIVADPATAQGLGIAASGEGIEGPEIFKPEATGPIYDALGHIEALLASFVLKLDHQKAKLIFTYSEQEKAALAEPTARVINKYSPAWIKERSDEIGLAVLLGTLTVQKVQLALAARQALNALAEVEAGTAGPTGHGPDSAGTKDGPIQ